MNLAEKKEALSEFIGDTFKVRTEWYRDVDMVASVAQNACELYADLKQCTAYKVKVILADESGSEMSAITTAIPMPVFEDVLGMRETYMLAIHGAYEQLKVIPNFIGLIAYSFVYEHDTAENLEVLANEEIDASLLKLQVQSWIKWGDELVPLIRAFGCQYAGEPGQSKITKIVELAVDDVYLDSEAFLEDMTTVTELSIAEALEDDELGIFYTHALTQVCNSIIEQY